MTITSTVNRASAAGNGVTTSFAFNYPVLASADLEVYVDGVLKTLTTHYTLSGSAPYTSGTNVQFLAAPANGTEVVLVRNPAITQTVDLVNGDTLNVDTEIETPLDKLTLICQRLDDRIGRSLTLSDSDTTTASTELPTPEAGKVIAWDDAGTALENVDPGSVTLATPADGSVTAAKLADSVFSGLTTVTAASGDYVAIADASDSGKKKKALVSDIPTAALGSSLVLISTASASNSAAIDFTSGINSSYDEYLLVITDLIPATNGSNLNLRVSEDGGATFKAGASDYSYANNVCTDVSSNAPTGSTGANAILVAASLCNVTTTTFCGEIRFWSPSGTAKNKKFSYDASYTSSVGNLLRLVGGGNFILDSNAINGIRLLMSAGNITSGNFALYGRRKS